MRKVCILQHRLLHYRVPLFERLKVKLEDTGIELSLVHGQPSPHERAKHDTGSLPWATVVHNSYLRIAGRDLLWQHLPHSVSESDLVIAMQENKILSNYWLQLIWRGSGRIFAFWGHGRNMQSVSPSGVLEVWKRVFLCRVDWWFAYTNVTTLFLKQMGYPDKRITCLNNTVDVAGFKIELAGIANYEICATIESLGIPSGAKIALFCGSLYSEKRLNALIDVAKLIRLRMDNFFLIVVGDGPQMDELKTISAGLEWIVIVGAKRGRDKATLHCASHLLLCPGALGLQILDSFAAGLPIATLATSLHGPEFGYLRDGENSIVIENDDLQELASRSVAVLSNDQVWQSLRRNCVADSDVYTLDAMVEKFAAGIVSCLAAPAALLADSS